MTETTEPERLTPEQLKTLFLFEALDDDQLAWLAERGRVVEYAQGATIHAEGAPASCLFVLLSGTMAMSGRVQGGEIELFRSDYYGSYTGAFDAYPGERRSQVYSGTARAITDCRLFELPAVDFGRAVREWFPMATHLLEGRSIQGQAATDTIARHERLVALGTVTAGLTHELNNPVAALTSASARLRDMLAEMREKIGVIVRSQLPADQLEAISDLAGRALERRRHAPKLSPLEASDREDDLAFIGGRIGKVLERELSIAEKHHAAHVDLGLRSSYGSLNATTTFGRGDSMRGLTTSSTYRR